MSPPATHPPDHADYLAAALRWLRLRLERLNASSAQAGDPEDRELVEATVRMEAAEAAFPPALAILGDRLGLSGFERQVLLLCAAMELDPSVASACARAQDDMTRAYPTFALALALFDDPAWDALSPEGPLRRFHLVEVHQPGGQTLLGSRLRLDERIVHYIKGLNYLDERVAALVLPVSASGPDRDLPPSQRAVVTAILEHWHRPGLTWPPVVQLLGPDPISKELVAAGVAAQAGLHLFRLPVASLSAHAGDVELFARLWWREDRLLPLALYIDAQESDLASAEGPTNLVARFISRSNGWFFLASRASVPHPGRPSVTLDVAKPTPEEQASAWSAELSGTSAAAESPVRLASQYDLNHTTIRQITHAARAEGGEIGLSTRLWDACRAAVRPRLDALAQRLEPRATRDDLVLPDETLDLLDQVIAQVRNRGVVYRDWGFARRMNRGLGISVLFAGPSGTGKTMAAEVLADALRLDLYRIDLSAVVSKYIGETEKNLRRLFDAAEDGGVILFFDEADALYGKRSEVKDSHDRYANIEVNYLLQRMDAYRGLAILATNVRKAIDWAFLRRLRFILDFPAPDPALRRQIWRRAFPRDETNPALSSVPMAELDYDRLAAMDFNGGSIHNVALNATFLAAEAAAPVDMPMLLKAARAEFLKLQRPVVESAFRPRGPREIAP
jgi:MoxR-like ATPase